MPSNRVGLMGQILGADTLPGDLSEEQRRGLLANAKRAFGAELLTHALNPNIGTGLGAAVQAGQGSLQAGAYDTLALQRQREQDALRQESTQALIEQRRAGMERVRADTRRRLAAEGEREQNVAISRQRLAEAGIDAQGLGDDQVLDLASNYISRAVESKAASMYPAPVPPDPGLTTAQESYYGLANRQADLRARELDMRGQPEPAPSAVATATATGVDIAGSLERILAAAPADKRDALRAEFERRSRTEDPVELLAKLNRMVGSLAR